MSSSFMNENDLVRLGEESRLTEQAPSALPEEPSALESGIPAEPEENPGIALIIALANMLTDRGIT